ncbi:E3 ubiquitin-protein ligase rnf168 [Dermacentor silvarum]|uniref:E3 ubiquitin-protein ligase rnf168 n=1 Tax=Dermacentor silvarum TaxID=543639 RepID=UPI002100F154|nr:E3 ubiquitin-protein ligase rnf168 [Dermacentor silvarum]
MAPRRKRLSSSSSPDSGNGSSSDESLTESDVTCPVCLSMVVEPVTMPCAHEVCNSCFTSTVLMANKECPMCRMRIASWARKAAREGTLVNRTRWELIKSRFPQQVARRLSGDDSRAGTPQRIVLRSLCEPGEIRREYEEQRQRAEAEWRQERELEAQAGEALAQQLASEEERALEEQRRQLRRDQRLACLWGVFGDTPAVLAAVPLVRTLLMPEEEDDNDSASSFMPPEDRPQGKGCLFNPSRQHAVVRTTYSGPLAELQPAAVARLRRLVLFSSSERDAAVSFSPAIAARDGVPTTPLRGDANRLCSRSVQTALLEMRPQETQTSEHGDDTASYLEDLQLARRIQRQLNRESRQIPGRVYNLRSRVAN